MSLEGLVHYIVIRRDLTFGEYSAQLAHAGEAYYMRAVEERSRSITKLEYNMVTAIVKGIRNEGRLRKLQGELIAAGIKHIAIVESEDPPTLGILDSTERRSLKGQMTCVSLMPDLRENVERY